MWHGEDEDCRAIREPVKPGDAKEIRSVTMHHVGDEGMVGIYAQAEIVVAGTIQEVCSGGLWGIESDSDDEYVTEVETEELGELTLILKELGFSQDAIEEAYADLTDAE